MVAWNPPTVAAACILASVPCISGSTLRCETIGFFFPPVWPIRTRHGPYNCVSSEKQWCTGLVWSKNLRQIIMRNQPNNKNHIQKTTRKSLRFASKQNSEATQKGAGPNKNQHKNSQICLGYSDLSHCIILKSVVRPLGCVVIYFYRVSLRRILLTCRRVAGVLQIDEYNIAERHHRCVVAIPLTCRNLPEAHHHFVR